MCAACFGTSGVNSYKATTCSDNTEFKHIDCNTGYYKNAAGTCFACIGAGVSLCT